MSKVVSRSRPLGENLREQRRMHGLAVKDVAAWLGCSDRTVVNWENGATPMPAPTYETFLKRLSVELHQREASYSMPEEILTVVDEDGRSASHVLAQRNYLDHWLWNDGTATIESMAVDRTTLKPFTAKIDFVVEPHNAHVLNAVIRWKRERMLAEMGDVDRDAEGPYKLLSWLVPRVRAAEAANPELVSAKKAVARAARALSLGRTDDHAELQSELNVALEQLALQIGRSI